MNEKQTVNVPVSEPETLRPTKKQKELLGFIENFINEHGYSPSYREIMVALDYTSVATVALHIGNLIKRGHLRKRDRSARSLEVVNPTFEQSAPLLTNQLKTAEEKWLVEKVEQLLQVAEAADKPQPEQLDNLYTLVRALSILGAEGAAQSFIARLGGLKQKILTD